MTEWDHTTTCAAPVFNPSGQAQGQSPPVGVQIGISTTTSGAQMRYTWNGSTPTSTNGTLINGSSGYASLGVNISATLKAIAFKSGNYDSPVTSGYYDNTDPGGGGHAPGHDGSGQRSADQTTSARLVNYTLDNCGNRTQVVDAGVSKSYVVNNLNEYTTGHGVAVTNGSSHEISAYNGTSYQYIGDSYLAKATAGTNTYTLFYDALGRCVKRTTVINGGAPTTNYYLFDGEHWVMEYDASGTNISNALYGREIDEVIARGVYVCATVGYAQSENAPLGLRMN